MKETDITEMTIGEIVARDYRAASVFKEVGIDFCCGGKKSLDEACIEKGLATDTLKERLKELESTPGTIAHNYIDWEPGFLCDYIVNTHHKYVLKSLPELVQYTHKIASVHGDRHPELLEVASLFSDINRELLQHLKNEEEVLFPSLKRVLNSNSVEFKTIMISEIARLSNEHEFAGGAMDKINIITHNYQVPADGCNTYKVTLKLLEQFEDDLHTHVHLENNILFPKALSFTNKNQ
jgi:regulator of cell morphogenesis and NO signaling